MVGFSVHELKSLFFCYISDKCIKLLHITEHILFTEQLKSQELNTYSILFGHISSLYSPEITFRWLQECSKNDKPH